jgi:hypothetical protein
LEASLDADIVNELNQGKGKEGECVIDLKKQIKDLMEGNASLTSKVLMLEEKISSMEKSTLEKLNCY